VEPKQGRARGGFTKGMNTRENKRNPWCSCGPRTMDKKIQWGSGTLYLCATVCG